MKEKLKTAVIGVGHLGQHHARVLHELEASEFVAVVDPDHERGKEIAGKYHVAALRSMEELPDDLDAVSIVTPTENHLDSARFALEHGWHVMVEKPITRTVEEAEQLVELGRKHDRLVQVGHIERFNSAVIELRKFLKEPRFVESHRLGPPTPRVKDIGVVKDLMIHDLDLLLSLVNSEVESVDAIGVPVLTRYEDIANARIRFKNGCIANLTVSRVTPEQMRKIRFFQADAYLSLDYQKQQLLIYRKVLGPGGMPSIDRKLMEMEKGDALTRELDAFLTSIREGLPPAVSAEDGLKALALAEQISSQVIEVP